MLMSDLTHRSLACEAHLNMLIENALYKFMTITITINIQGKFQGHCLTTFFFSKESPFEGRKSRFNTLFKAHTSYKGPSKIALLNLKTCIQAWGTVLIDHIFLCFARWGGYCNLVTISKEYLRITMPKIPKRIP